MIHCKGCNVITFNTDMRLHRGHNRVKLGSTDWVKQKNSLGKTIKDYLSLNTKGYYHVDLNSKTAKELLEIKELTDQLAK